MKNKLQNLFLLLAFLFSTGLKAENTSIYVSVSGNDSNPGTIKLPLASLAKALKIIETHSSANEKPSEIIVGSGIYFIDGPIVVSPSVSGAANKPLVIKAAEGATPVFYGGKKLNAFEQVSKNLWHVKIPETSRYGWYFEQLYVNGKRATRAKSPNSGFYFLKDVRETVLYGGDSRAPLLATQKLKLFGDGAQQLSLFEKQDFNDAVITLYHKWDNTKNHIAGFEKDSAAIFMFGKGMKSWNKLDSKTRYNLENYKAALDTCGEWYLDRTGELFYIPQPGETIENTVAIAPISSQFIILKGNEETGEKVKNIRFEGLSFQVSAYQMPVKGTEPAQAAFPVEASIMADYAENIHFSNCEISQTGNNAIWFRNACNNCSIEHCYLHDLGAGGVKIGNFVQPEKPENLTKNILVNNSIIRDGGHVFPCAVGLTIFHASDNTVTHNEIADFRYSGVSVGWIWGYAYSPSKRNKIEFNHIHHLGWGELCDMGGVYCLGSSEGTIVSNNVIHHVYSFDYGGWGLYTDEGSTGIVMENNLVYHCKNSGFHQHYGKENIIRNNIFADNLKAQLQATRVEEHLSFTFSNNLVWFTTGDVITSNWYRVRLNSDNNCYWNPNNKEFQFKNQSFADWQKSGKDQHSIIADPGFVAPEDLNFRLKNKKVANKIGFKEFDYSRAGVNGSDEWVKLAKFNPEKEILFEKAIEKNENRRLKP